MFEEFGRMNVFAMNAKAEQLTNAGDLEGLKRLAQENRLPESFVDMYIDGETDYFCTDIIEAAMGRIDIEADDLGAEEIMGDWVEYIRSLIMESEAFAEMVMAEKKSLIGCIGVLAGYAITHAEPLPEEILKAMDKAVSNEQLKKLGLERRHLKYTKIGMPGIGTAKRLIRKYYEEG